MSRSTFVGNGSMDTNDTSTPIGTVPFDVNGFLAGYLGCRHRGLAESITLSVIYCVVLVFAVPLRTCRSHLYCVVLVTGVVGNVATCVVVSRNKYMHTATNYYLVSLAVSDMLALVFGLPPELYTIWEAYPWRFGEAYCLFRTFLMELVWSASVLTITAFSIERYVAICHPLRAHALALSSPARVVKVIVFVWIAAAGAALPYPLNTRTYHYVRDPATYLPLEDSLVCNIPLEWMPTMKYVIPVSTLVLFVCPMCAMTVLYISMALVIKSSVTRDVSSSNSCRHQTETQSLQRRHSNARTASPPRRTVLRILVAVLVTFFVCWAPFHAQRIMTACVPNESWTSTLIEIQTILFYMSGILYYVNSTVNPVLYNVMSNRYREAFIETLCKGRPRRASLGLVRAKETGAPVTGSRGMYAMFELDEVNASATRRPTVERVDCSSTRRCDRIDADRSPRRSGPTSSPADGLSTRNCTDLVATSTLRSESTAAPSSGPCQSRLMLRMRNRLATWRAESVLLAGRPARGQGRLLQTAGKVRGRSADATVGEPANTTRRVGASDEVQWTGAGRRHSTESNDNSEKWLSASTRALAGFIRDEWV